MNKRKLLNIELNRLSTEEYKRKENSGIVLVLDNVRSSHNVGSAFRSSDAFAVDKIWLCGICNVPPSAEIHKSALGAEDAVQWEYREDASLLIDELKSEGYVVVSVEQTVDSKSLKDFKREANKKYALIFGNEVAGVQQELVDKSDFSLEIPQYGTKHSLNVSVSMGVVLWHFQL